jgi:hypothetical protein
LTIALLSTSARAHTHTTAKQRETKKGKTRS